MTDPLFANSRAELVSQIRLTGANGDDAVAAIDAAIRAVAVNIYDAIGESKVGQIRGTAFSDDPTASKDVRLRLKAATMEEKWVRAELLRKMPVLFRESRGASYDRFNEEGIGEDAQRAEDEIRRLMADVYELLDDINGDASSSRISAVTFGPEKTPVIRPGQSVRPCYSCGKKGVG